MEDLRALCAKAGFAKVRTYIASGNVIFSCRKPEAQVKAVLEAGLEAYAGKRVGVFVRTAAEMAEVSANNPFPEAPSNRIMAFSRRGQKGRADRARNARDLCSLRRGDGQVQAQDSGGQGRNGAQHEYRHQTRRTRSPTLSACRDNPPASAAIFGLEIRP